MKLTDLQALEIRELLVATYGNSGFVLDLAEHLCHRIEEHPKYPGDDDLNRVVMMVCWDWMTGGDTAAYVADVITQEILDV